MRTGPKLAAFGVVLALAIGGGAGVGAVAGPIDVGGGGTDDDHGHADGAPAAPVAAAPDIPPPRREATVDGIQVALAGEPRAGESELAFTLRRDGEALRPDPYLGAAGHLVAIRAADLAYLHVHPLDGAGDAIRFAADFPSPGAYRLYLDFSEGGQVRTAAFTVVVADPAGAAPAVPDPAGAAPATTPPTDGDHEAGH